MALASLSYLLSNCLQCYPALRSSLVEHRSLPTDAQKMACYCLGLFATEERVLLMDASCLSLTRRQLPRMSLPPPLVLVLLPKVLATPL